MDGKANINHPLTALETNAEVFKDQEKIVTHVHVVSSLIKKGLHEASSIHLSAR